MKRFILAIATAALSSTATADLYAGVGGAPGSKQDDLGVLFGARLGPVAVEASYASNPHVTETIGVALVGYATLGRANGQPIELVGRAERALVSDRGVDEWRSAVGAGLQIGAVGRFAGRFIFERAGDESRVLMHLLYRF